MRYFSTPVVEVSIDWREIGVCVRVPANRFVTQSASLIDGSKMNLAQASLQMAVDLARIRFYYTTGVWSCTK
jgi:hypothetical protein